MIPNLCPGFEGFITLREWREGRKISDISTNPQRYSKGLTPGLTSVDWAKWAWSPVTGCLNNCTYCIAREIANTSYAQKFKPSLIPSEFYLLDATNYIDEYDIGDVSYRNILTCFMADLFGEWVPDEWIHLVLERVERHDRWNYLFLTKYPERQAKFKYFENCWIGNTVDLQCRVDVVEREMEVVEAGLRWLSVEPMLEPLTFKKPNLFNWIVVGGASRTSKTPRWTPPFEWIARLYCTFKDAGAAVYIEENAGFRGEIRPKEIPGRQDQFKSASDLLYYLNNK